MSYDDAFSRSSASPSLFLEWPLSCNFSTYANKQSYVYHTYTLEKEIANEDACMLSCKCEASCGMYWWASGNLCFKYQHSVLMWSRVGLTVDDMLQDYELTSTIGSKNCKEETKHEECNKSWNYTDRKYPSGSIFNYVRTLANTSLTVSACQKLCGMFPLCRSVRYWHYHKYDQTGGLLYCELYNTSLSDGEDKKCSSNESPCGTYERYCNGELYDPTKYSSTTTVITPATTTSLRPTTTPTPPTTTSLPPTTTTPPPTTTSPPPTTTSQLPTTTSPPPTTTSPLPTTTSTASAITSKYLIITSLPPTTNSQTLSVTSQRPTKSAKPHPPVTRGGLRVEHIALIALIVVTSLNAIGGAIYLLYKKCKKSDEEESTTTYSSGNYGSASNYTQSDYSNTEPGWVKN